MKDNQKDALATLLALREEKPDEKVWKLIVETEQVVGHGRKDWWSGCPRGVDGYYKSGVTKGALSNLYKHYVDEGVLEPLDHGPSPKVIDIDHPVLTTVEAEYDRAMIASARREKEQEYAFAKLLERRDPDWIGEDQRPDNWEFIPWWKDEALA